MINKIIKSLIFSLQGFLDAFKEEKSFQLEVVGLVILLFLLNFLPFGILEKFFLFSSYLIILICELFNTGLERIVNQLSLEKSEFARKVKDFGSGTVLLAIVIHISAWITSLLMLSE